MSSSGATRRAPPSPGATTPALHPAAPRRLDGIPAPHATARNHDHPSPAARMPRRSCLWAPSPAAASRWGGRAGGRAGESCDQPVGTVNACRHSCSHTARRPLLMTMSTASRASPAPVHRWRWRAGGWPSSRRAACASSCRACAKRRSLAARVGVACRDLAGVSAPAAWARARSCSLSGREHPVCPPALPSQPPFPALSSRSACSAPHCPPDGRTGLAIAQPAATHQPTHPLPPPAACPRSQRPHGAVHHRASRVPAGAAAGRRRRRRRRRSGAGTDRGGARRGPGWAPGGAQGRAAVGVGERWARAREGCAPRCRAQAAARDAGPSRGCPRLASPPQPLCAAPAERGVLAHMGFPS